MHAGRKNTSIMQRISFFLLAFLCLAATAFAQDWASTPVPANAGAGKVWQLQTNFSDDFNYNGKTPAFRGKWNDTYWNPWTGPGLTHWTTGSTSITGGKLVIGASRRTGTNKVNCGVVTSKTKVIYPIYMEARIKVSNLELSSNFWMLSETDEREIDVLEVYGGASQDWFTRNMSTNFHVFLRNEQTNAIISDFNDQNHVIAPNGGRWRDAYHNFGVYWKSPSEVFFYIDGVQTADGSWAQSVMFDKDYTQTTMDKNVYKMDQPMFMIIDTEDHAWRSNQGIVASDADLANNNKNKMYVDWVRTYKPVNAPTTGNNSITNLTSAGSVSPGGTITANFNFSSNGNNRDILVYLQKDSAPWTVYGQRRIQVNSGTGSRSLSITAPANLPIANNNLQLQVMLTTRNGGWSNRFANQAKTNIDGVAGGGGQVIANGTYNLRSPFNGQNLGAFSWNNHNARMINAGNFSDQKWDVIHLGNNIYHVKNVGTGRFLEVPFARCQPTNVATYTSGAGNHQRFKIEKIGSSYYLRPAHCQGQALDRAYGATDANVGTYNYDAGNNNLKWNFVSVPKNGPGERLTAPGKGDEVSFAARVYPNPAPAGQAFLELNLSDDQPVELAVYDVSGRQLTSRRLEGRRGVTRLGLDREVPGGLAAGVYLLRVASGGETVTQRVVVR